MQAWPRLPVAVAACSQGKDDRRMSIRQSRGASISCCEACYVIFLRHGQGCHDIVREAGADRLGMVATDPVALVKQQWAFNSAKSASWGTRRGCCPAPLRSVAGKRRGKPGN